ncbi:MAG: zinc-dependent peptidase [Gammaproteobacteria bacterium]
MRREALWVGLVVLVVLALQIVRPLYRRAQRQRRLGEALSPQQREVIRRHVPLIEKLPEDFRARHEGLVRVFLAEKEFIGCAGLNLRDEMRWSIAAQACLLLINRADGCFDDMRTVLVYPEAFYVEHEEVDASGVAQQRRRLLSGESWSEGQVIVSWADALRGGALAADGYNVVIHEFAHQLDGANGDVNGAPMLGDEMPAEAWSRTMKAGFETLLAAMARGETTLIDAYGGTHPAEFFAVTSEVFFEKPQALVREHPELYACLQAVYRIDPARWH